MATILERQMHHGPALIQIAEHDEFTNINRIDLPNTEYRSAFSVNGEIGIFLKYSTTPRNTNPVEHWVEYWFGFSKENLDDMNTLMEDQGDAYAVLVINDDVLDNKEICCISYHQLFSFKRARDAKIAELRRAKVEGITIRVRIRRNQLRNQPFYVNVKQAGSTWYYEVPMSAFPDKIFG